MLVNYYDHFSILQMFCYERLVDVLLSMLRHDYRDEFIHRLGIFLLNCLACQVDGKEKELVGNMGAVDVSHFSNVCLFFFVL